MFLRNASTCLRIQCVSMQKTNVIFCSHYILHKHTDCVLLFKFSALVRKDLVFQGVSMAQINVNKFIICI